MNIEKDIMKCEKTKRLFYNITKKHVKEDLVFSRKY